MELLQNLFAGDFAVAQSYFTAGTGQFVSAVIFFIIGLLLIMFGGDRFVDASITISKKLGIPEIIVGATIVSLGTALPEILVSTTAAFSGGAGGDMAVGNAFGSIVCNTALIAAVTQLFKPSKSVSVSSIGWRSILFFAVYVIVSTVGLLTGGINRIAGIFLLLAFCLYAYLSIKLSGGDDEEAEEGDDTDGSVAKAVITLVICAAVLFVGAKFLVNCGASIAAKVGVPEAVISVTFIALGTSLPEFVTAISSMIKGYSNVSVGNIIGANTLNLLLVIGIPATATGIGISQKESFMLTAPVGLLVMLLFILPFVIKKKGFRWQGALLLVIYAAYSVIQFVMA